MGVWGLATEFFERNKRDSEKPNTTEETIIEEWYEKPDNDPDDSNSAEELPSVTQELKIEPEQLSNNVIDFTKYRKIA